jgi:hypothetical protein
MCALGIPRWIHLQYSYFSVRGDHDESLRRLVRMYAGVTGELSGKQLPT